MVKNGAPEGGSYADENIYQDNLGSFMYLSTRVRPNVSLAVKILSRICVRPTSSEMFAAKFVMRYLSGKVLLFLRLKKTQDTFICWAGANWAEDRTERKSTSGLHFSGTPVLWRSKKQNHVAL